MKLVRKIPFDYELCKAEIYHVNGFNFKARICFTGLKGWSYAYLWKICIPHVKCIPIYYQAASWSKTSKYVEFSVPYLPISITIIPIWQSGWKDPKQACLNINIPQKGAILNLKGEIKFTVDEGWYKSYHYIGHVHLKNFRLVVLNGFGFLVFDSMEDILENPYFKYIIYVNTKRVATLTTESLFNHNPYSKYKQVVVYLGKIPLTNLHIKFEFHPEYSDRTYKFSTQNNLYYNIQNITLEDIDITQVKGCDLLNYILETNKIPTPPKYATVTCTLEKRTNTLYATFKSDKPCNFTAVAYYNDKPFKEFSINLTNHNRLSQTVIVPLSKEGKYCITPKGQNKELNSWKIKA